MANIVRKFENVVAFNDFLEKRTEEIEKVLPKSTNVAKFKRIVLNAVNATPDLLNCDPQSLFVSLMTCAELNLMPNTILGHCYILPYNEKQKDGTYTKKAQFQFGYRGLLDLARRTKEIASIEYDAVYKEDLFDFAKGTASYIKHKPTYITERVPANLTHVWALVYFTNGAPATFDVMPKSEVEKHRLKSKKPDGFGWKDWYEEMAIKTLLRKMFKLMPLSSEFHEQIAKEQDLAEVDTSAYEAPKMPETTIAPSLEITTREVSEQELEEVFPVIEDAE